jgi:hypothetical protein
MNRFFIYEEYGAKYELMMKDIACAHRTMPQWEAYQRGLEALASSLSSINQNTQQGNSRKALTVGDLLVKVRCLSQAWCGINHYLANSTSVQVSALIC